eukprot:PhM_4_TR13934/c0_g1_i1/m.43673
MDTDQPTSTNLWADALTSKDLEDLTARSDGHGAVAVAAHAFVILLGALSQSYLPFGLGAILQGFFMFSLFNALHEFVHGTAFKSKRLNETMAVLCGVLTMRPPVHYRCYHYGHHRHTGDPERDPELQSSFIDLPLTTLPRYLLYLSGVAFWIDRVSTILRHAAGYFLPRETYLTSTSELRVRVVAEAQRHVVGYLCVVLLCALFPVTVGHSLVWRYWALPSVYAQMFLRFYLLAEHTGCRHDPHIRQNTRTLDTFAWYAALAWNMPYHSEHHAFPRVPFHALPRLHKKLQGTSFTSSSSGCTPDGTGGYWSVHANLLRQFGVLK